jgi:Domain of unknown function (DUF4375)
VDKNQFLIELSEGHHTDVGRVPFARQSPLQKVFSAVWELESQVNNGGFDQYLRFSDYDAIVHAPIALRQIGAPSCAALVERAIGLVQPLPPTREGRHDALDALPEDTQRELESLDSDFYAYPDDLTALLFDFVRKNPGAFGPVPTDIESAPHEHAFQRFFSNPLRVLLFLIIAPAVLLGLWSLVRFLLASAR